MAHERVLILYTSISASPLKTSIEQQKNRCGMENKLDLVEWFLFLLEEITDLKDCILSVLYSRSIPSPTTTATSTEGRIL